MESQNFIDHVRIYAKAGDGGAGMLHFRREKYVSKGGPDGGDGGRGGDLGIVAEADCWTLLHLRYTKHLRAGDGEKGGKNKRHGADGKDVWLRVPIGTVAKDGETKLLGEVLRPGDRLRLLRGGKGGHGNAYFATPTRRSPDHAQAGLSGEEITLTLELKLLADVGLVGQPNAGKSTLLSRLSAARPRIAPYAFTTLQPVLGVVGVGEYRSFVMADLPGLIKGAAEGKGLGTRFLRHVERNALLLFVISAEVSDISSAYAILQLELQTYSPDFDKKPQLLVISKSDLLNETRKKELYSTIPQQLSCYFVSSWTGEGLQQLPEILWQALRK